MEANSSAAADMVPAAARLFAVMDYVLFSLMLASCLVIGVYYGFFKAKADAEEYLVGSRSMKVLPVAMSLVASFISGITLLGTPTEVYLFGTQFAYITITISLMALALGSAYLPVFHELRLTSTYEYLELRFGKNTRLFSSFFYVIGVILWIPIVIYIPALAFNQVTGINVHVITPAVCLVCIFYTCVGGLKAVVWTDVVQTAIMFGAVVLVMIKGTVDLGGLGVVWSRNYRTGRIQPPDLTLDPTVRHSWLVIMLGGFFYMMPMCVSQMAMQRFLAIEKRSNAIKALWIFVVGSGAITLMSCYTGLLIFAAYHDCDPLTTKVAKHKDQLLPLLVVDTLRGLPGFSGVFVAGVFSAALSSMSTGLNSLAAVLLEDLKTLLRRPLTARQTDLMMKGVVVVAGVLCTALVYFVEQLGSVLQLYMSLTAITHGPILGIFSSGLFFPWVTSTGAVAGGVVGLVSTAWLILGTQAHIMAGDIRFRPKPLSTAGCTYDFVPRNVTARPPPRPVAGVYRVSYLWYNMVGCVLTLVVALLVSWATGHQDPSTVDRRLISPVARRFLPHYQAVKTEAVALEKPEKVILQQKQ